ncbi:dynamin family protein [uncultured Ruthenibacterium sp.]|uniref:dynamin family protein n=1 Tax=uncultured Ruthenibacterium sp. TaxID=1905347 RepID=UPI00349EB1AA
MDNLVQLAQEAAELCKKYGLSQDELEHSAAEIQDYHIRVAVLGGFNTGKSALINALLGIRLVGVSLSEETLFPTEIFYGSPEAAVFRNGRFYRSDPSILREQNETLSNVQMARASLSLPFLKQIPDLSLLDTPGIGTFGATHSSCFPELVRQAGAYLLVFGADAPVITETMMAFLSTLPLADRPVLCVLTKCDQFNPRQIDKIAAFLEKDLSSQLGLPNPVLCRVHGSASSQFGKIQKFLQNLQVQADAIKEERIKNRLLVGTAPLIRYLDERIQNHRLLEPELAQKASSLDRRLEQLRTTVQQLNDGTHHLIEEAGAHAAVHSRNTLLPLASPLAEMLTTGQDPLPFADSALLSIFRAEARSRIFPILESYEKAMFRLSSLYQLHLPPAVAGQAEESMNASFGGTEEIFSSHPMTPDALLSAMQIFVESQITHRGLHAFEILREALNQPVYDQLQSLQKALEDTRLQQSAQAMEHRATLDQLQCDLKRLQELTGCAKEGCTYAF